MRKEPEGSAESGEPSYLARVAVPDADGAVSAAGVKLVGTHRQRDPTDSLGVASEGAEEGESAAADGADGRLLPSLRRLRVSLRVRVRVRLFAPTPRRVRAGSIGGGCGLRLRLRAAPRSGRRRGPLPRGVAEEPRRGGGDAEGRAGVTTTTGRNGAPPRPVAGIGGPGVGAPPRGAAGAEAGGEGLGDRHGDRISRRRRRRRRE